MRTIATFASKSPLEWGCRLQACVSHLDVVGEIGGERCLTYRAAAAPTSATCSGTGRILGVPSFRVLTAETEERRYISGLFQAFGF